MNGNEKCKECGWNKNCNGLLKEQCENRNYELFISEYDKKMCDMMCNVIED